MNNRRREKLKRAISKLGQSAEEISNIIDEEQDCLDNIPENLQASDRYENMEMVIDLLEDSVSSVESALEKIEEAIAQ